MNPDVSVVIPSYNHAAFVGEAVESALACRRVEIEIVIVDDGSTDDSRQRLAEYADDPRVRLELQDNRGAHAALNRGCSIARGRYIFILDSDDAFHPDRIPALLERLRAHPGTAVVASFIEVVDAAGGTIGVKEAWGNLPPWQPPHPGPRLSDLDDPTLALLETNWISTTSNLAFPAGLVRDVGLRFSALRYAHDWDFILSACRHGAVDLVERPLLRYRVHGANTIGEGVDRGRGSMRFEIMWVVARHAASVVRAAADGEDRRIQLRDLLLRSAPTFGRDEIFEMLLLLRGHDETPPEAFDALVDEEHPFTRAAVDALQV
jgi:glycosyltransferase involved in cell wall biosynthesis